MPVVEEIESTHTPVNPPRGFLLAWIRVALKWHRLAWRMTAAIMLLAFAAALLLPNHYTATIVILPPTQSGSSGAAMMAQLSSMGGMAAATAAGGVGIKNPNDQQVALLKSRTVEDAMVERFQLQSLYHRKYVSAARKRWERATTIDNGIKDGLIHITVTDRDPRRAANMANGWVEEYRRFTATLAITEASQRRLFYERQLSAAHNDLVQAEDAMAQTEQRTGVIDIEGQDRSISLQQRSCEGNSQRNRSRSGECASSPSEGNPDLQRAQQEAVGMEGQLAVMDAAHDRRTGDLVAPKGTVTQASLDYARALREVKYRETIQDLLTRSV